MYALCRLYGNSHFLLLFPPVRDALKLLTTNARICALYLLLTFTDYSWCLYMLLWWKLFYVWQDKVKSNCLLGNRNLYTAISFISEGFCCMHRGSTRHPPPSLRDMDLQSQHLLHGKSLSLTQGCQLWPNYYSSSQCQRSRSLLGFSITRICSKWSYINLWSAVLQFFNGQTDRQTDTWTDLVKQ